METIILPIALSFIFFIISIMILQIFFKESKYIKHDLSEITSDLNQVLISFIPLIVYFDYITKTNFNIYIYWTITIIFIIIPFFYLASLIIDKYEGKILKQLIISFISIIIIAISIWLALEVADSNTNDKITNLEQNYKIKNINNNIGKQ